MLEALHPYKCRCSDNDLPWRFEIGTPPVELLAGLTACVEHFGWLGELVGEVGDRRSKIAAGFAHSIAYEDVLVDQLLTGLEAIDGVEIYGPLSGVNRAPRVPTVSFRHRGVGPEAIAKSLGDTGIFVWSGHNYAYEMARTLGIEKEGGVRIGIAHYNTKEEVQAVIEGVKTAVGEMS